jgi:hypothetical protein
LRVRFPERFIVTFCCDDDDGRWPKSEHPTCQSTISDIRKEPASRICHDEIGDASLYITVVAVHRSSTSKKNDPVVRRKRMTHCVLLSPCDRRSAARPQSDGQSLTVARRRYRWPLILIEDPMIRAGQFVPSAT